MGVGSPKSSSVLATIVRPTFIHRLDPFNKDPPTQKEDEIFTKDGLLVREFVYGKLLTPIF